MKRRLRVSAALALAAPLASLGVHQAAAEPVPATAQDATPAQAVWMPPAPLEPRPVVPVSGYRLTGQFGDSAGPWAHGHTGLDFAVPYGTTIEAIVPGVVASSEYDGAYGLKIVIKTRDGVELWFCHLADSDVEPGDRVQPGQPIGEVGTSGNTTGPHLHLEVHDPDPVDPYAWLRDLGARL